MKYVKIFEVFKQERDLIRLLVKALHEGIKVVKSEAVLNESNLSNYAQTEIETAIRLAKETGDSLIIQEFVPEILSLVEKFAQSGQSGGSAPYTAGAIVSALKKLLMFQPLAPVTGEDDEWENSFEPNGYQNKRCFALFKNGKNGDPYYLNAIVFKDQKGLTWTGSATLANGEKLYSKQFIKEFPFEPKTFVIDIIDKEIAPDDWEFCVKDDTQLEEVYNYYKKSLTGEKE